MDFKNLSQFGKINMDDDLVIVVQNGEIIYNGIEDYEPMKDEPWKWNSKEKCYELDNYKKYCLI